jgi:hypothetical protein
MKTFIWNHGKPQAMKKYNDDLIIACAIGCWVKDIAFTINQRELEYKKAFLNCMKKSDTTINTSIPGMEGYKSVEKQKHIEEQYEHLWLLKG